MKKFGLLKDVKQTGSKINLTFEFGDGFIDIITADIVRVYSELEKEEKSFAIEGDKHKYTEFNVRFVDGELIVATDKMIVRVGEDFKVSVFKENGLPLLLPYIGERKKKEKTGDNYEILKAEGHEIDLSGRITRPVEVFFKLDKADCFYGLGDKTGFMNKRGYEFVNWNSDLPQAHNEDFKSLYKSVPVLYGLREGYCFGLFFDNTYKTVFNIGQESEEYLYVGSEGGNLDYYVFISSKFTHLVEKYTYLTGRTPLPQLFTLGYQQSRWGYNCAEDIMEVAKKYRELNIPLDVIHLDIDYMDGYRVFTWNESDYGHKGELFDELKKIGVKPVTIIDPGVKKDENYFMYKEGIEKGYFVIDKGGMVYENAVWPGTSVFPDFGKSEVRKWWGKNDGNLMSLGAEGIWNDMNEPASFNGPLPADVQFSDELEKTNHTRMHNVYGHLMAEATFNGIKDRTGKRPFIITRACFAGTQKYSTVWTGDNQSLWHHLQMLVPQLCNLSISGFSICGTDIGGFGAHATPELLTRWIEAAVFSPLFRNHSALGTRRQEPWFFDEKTVNIYRKYVNLRYQFLPYIYDLLYKGLKTGLPVMRPLVLHYQNDPETYNLNGEFMVGDSMIVAPVLEQGATKKLVYLPEGTWYLYSTGKEYSGRSYFVVDAPIDECPIFIKAGAIIPTVDVVQYVGEKNYDKLTLLTTPGYGYYEHFQDNGTDYTYEDGQYNLYEFSKEDDESLVTEMLHEGFPKYREIVLKDITR